MYEHHHPFLFPKWVVAAGEAPLILRQKRRRVSIATGQSGCLDFSPAHRFELGAHLAPQLDGKYVLTRVTHHGEAAGKVVYFNAFECAPAEMPYPPRRPKRRSVQVALTATVVGPEHEEIHVDDKARIKVQFHWDRAGQYDHNSSCWIRTMQPWAGASWGHQFIPRVGTEVVVVFEGGDPDKPMILGSVYNGTHQSPFALPANKTMSGIRTRTSPGGEGFNELSFEDAAGREQIFVHAQKDLRENVLHRRVVEVGDEDSLSVATRRTTAIGTDCDESVGMQRTMTVGKNLHVEIGGDHHSRVRGLHSDVVKRARATTIGGNFSTAVRGTMATIIGTKEEPRSADLYAHGEYSIGATKYVRIRAESGVVLSCGESRLELTPDGVLIKGKRLFFEGTESATVRGNGPALQLGDAAEITADTMRFVSSSASLELAQDAKLDGKMVKLNCPGVAKDPSMDVPPPETKKLVVQLTDEDFQPIAGKQYILSAAGVTLEGTTDGSGKVDAEIPAEAETASLTVFVEKRPEGKQLKYRIQLEDLPPPDTIAGLKARLQNLGYFWGDVNEELDEVAKSAISHFQYDHGLEVTGHPDDETKARIAEIARQ